MKLEILLNPIIADQLLDQPELSSRITFTCNKDGEIIKRFIIDNVIDNDENTFRLLSLELIKKTYLSVYDCAENLIEINSGDAKAKFVFRSDIKGKKGIIAELGDELIE